MVCRIDKRSFLAKAVCAFGRCVNLSLSFSRARLTKASLRGLRHWLAGPWCRLASRHRKRSKRFWRERGSDCAFWSGSLYRFVQPSRTARCSDPAGQSPLPEKIRTILEAARWRPCFLVGLAQLLRTTFSDCQMLRPSRTVAATAKDPHDLGGSTVATALFGRARFVASRDLLGLPDAQA